MSASSSTIPARADVPRETTWDTYSIFASPADWQAAFDGLQTAGADLAARFAGKLGDSPQTLADYFGESEAVQRRLSHVLIYASLTYSVDTNDSEAVARFDRARGLFARTSAALAFAEPELLSIGVEKLQTWAQENQAGLGTYAHYFDQLSKRAPHVRSSEVESLLKQLGEPFGGASSIHGVLTNTDLKFAPATGQSGDEHEIGQGTIGKLLSDPDALSDNLPVERQQTFLSRLLRNPEIAMKVKRLHDYQCQVCGLRLETPVGPYAEAAHIRPLGIPHNGPDVLENILCLCPNHHILFDAGAFVIEADGYISGTAQILRRTYGHAVSEEYLAYHRSLFASAAIQTHEM